MVNTRNSKRGRLPALRDQILALLASNKNGLTCGEIAELVHRDETTPFRPLKDLRQMELVETYDSDDGTVYFINDEKYQEFRNNNG